MEVSIEILSKYLYQIIGQHVNFNIKNYAIFAYSNNIFSKLWIEKEST